VEGRLGALGGFVLQKSKMGCGDERSSIIDGDCSYLLPVPVRSAEPRVEPWEEHLRCPMVAMLFYHL